MNKELTKNCVQCNTEFNYVPNKLNEQKYCSKVCRNKFNNIRRIQLIRDEYINVTPIINENVHNSNFPHRQRERIQNIDNTENNKDFYTLYLEEKHARHIEQLENYYNQALNRSYKIIEDLKEDNEEDEELPENDNLLKNVIGGLSEIGKQILKYKENDGKVVKM